MGLNVEMDRWGYVYAHLPSNRKKGSKEIPGVTLGEDGSITSYSIEDQCHSVFQNIKFTNEGVSK